MTFSHLTSSLGYYSIMAASIAGWRGRAPRSAVHESTSLFSPLEPTVLHSRKVLACATVMEEMLPLLPEDMPRQVLDFGLHVNPASLKAALQAAIDASAAEAETIVLGYGFCSMAVVGLKANGCTLVVPHVDDCISHLPRLARSVHQASQRRARHLLSHQGLDRGGRHAVQRVRPAGREVRCGARRAPHSPLHQALYPPRPD